MTHIGIQTTQNVLVEYPTATLGDRVLASLLDRLILVVYAVVVISLIGNYVVGPNNRIIFSIIAFLPVMFYSLIFEIFMNGQTIGKIALQTRVIRLDGQEPTIGNYLLRWLLRLIDIWIMGGVIGFIAIAASGKGQRLGDMAAGTTVIRLRRRTYVSDTLAAHTEERPQYIPQFPQVELLSDKQASLIQEVLNAYHRDDNYEVVDSLDKKLRELLNIQPNLPPLDFLRTLLNDYIQLHSKGKVV
jgi:uncharacterized RDD family membrane protein YckC